MEKTIGKKLYELRKQSGYTQDFVAEKLGLQREEYTTQIAHRLMAG